MSESTVTKSTVTVADLTVIFTALTEGDTAPYASAEQGTKSKVRAMIEKSIKEALREKAFEVAGDLQDTLDLATSTKITKESAKVDLAEVIAQRVLDLRLAADLIEEGTTLPEGADDGSDDLFDRVQSILDSGEKSGSREVAAKIASTKITKSGDRTDLQAHVTQALVILGAESGDWFKISAVANVRTAAAPEGLPSQGALSARLFADGGCTLVGVEPTEATSTAPKGLRVL